jgi:ribosome maturation factor RimP
MGLDSSPLADLSCGVRHGFREWRNSSNTVSPLAIGEAFLSCHLIRFLENTGMEGHSLEKKERLSSLAGQIAEASELELVDVDLFRAGHREVIRVYLDCVGGISLGQCAEASRKLSDLLEADDLFQLAYTLEVSSPGLDRPLRTPRDWARRVGEYVRVHLSEPVEGKRTWIGKLVRSGEENAVVVSDKTQQEIEIPYRAVQLARVDVRFEE